MMNRDVQKDRQVVVARQHVKEKNYWLARLSGDLVRSTFLRENFKRDGEVPGIDRAVFEWTEPFHTKLMEIGGGSHYKLHVIVTAGIVLLLERYTGNRDIIVSTPIYKPDTGGKFVNTVLPLRVDTGEVNTFRELLKLISKCITGASDHQNYPLEVLMEQIDMPLIEGYPSLPDTGIVVENIHDPGHIRPANPGTVFFFRAGSRSLRGHLEYPPGKCDRTAAESIVINLQRLLDGALSCPDSPLDALDILSEEQKKQVLHDFNDTGTGSPGDKMIHQRFEEQVDRTPDRIAVQGVRPAASFTYGALSEESHRLARLLRQKGVKPCAVVGIASGRSPAYIAGVLGILKAGGAYLTIHSAFSSNGVKLENSGAEVLVTTEDFLGTIDFNGCEVRLNDLAPIPHVPPLPQPWDLPGNPACILYTPGVPGPSGGVVVEHRDITTLVVGLEAAVYSQYRWDEILNFCIVSSFASGDSFTQLFGSLLGGRRLHIVPADTGKDGTRLYRFYQAHCIDISDGTPTQLRLLAESREGGAPGHWMRHLIVGGEQLPGAVVEAFTRRFGPYAPALTHVYGTAESGGVAIAYDVSPGDIHREDRIPIGKALPFRRAYIMDRRGGLAPVGVVGQLWIAGAAGGYVKTPGPTAGAFEEDPFFPGQRMAYTGDLAHRLPDGTIVFSGKANRRVVLRGNLLAPEDMEIQLLAHPDVKEAVVATGEDGSLRAYLVTGKKTSIPVLKEFLSGKLPDYLIPASFFQLENMPLTPGGKIDREAVPGVEVRGREKYASPRDEVEKELAILWADTLEKETDNIRVDEDFARLGGASLKAIMLSSKIHKAFNVSIPIPEIFARSTIMGLAEYIKGALKSDYRSIEPAEKMEYYVLSPAQKRVYLLQEMNRESIGYNVPQVVRLEGRFRKDRLVEAFKGLIRRHETLRTSFQMVGDIPVQKVHGEVEFAVEYHDLEAGIDSVDGVETALQKERKIVNNFIKPFDLSRAPLLRVGLIKRDESHHILMVDRHHIISDAASRELFLEELIRLYDGEGLPGLRLQYKDYSRWLNSEEQRRKLDPQEAYWLRQFQGKIPVLALPTDYPRPARQSFEGGSERFEMGREETGKLREIAEKQGATLFMVLLTVYNILLSRVCGQEDIVIGSPVVGRRHVDLENIMGIFINTIALRNFPNDEKTFGRFLEEVKTRSLAAFENQMYPFEKLVEKVAAARDFGRNPLFDVSFNFQNLKGDGDRKGDGEPALNVKPYEHDIESAKFDIKLFVAAGENRLSFILGYCTKLFHVSTIRRFIGFFKKIVQNVTAARDMGVDRKLAEIDILTDEEKKQLLVDFNNTDAEYVEYPADTHLHRLFERQAVRTPDRTAAFSGIHGEGGTEPAALTYWELNNRSEGFARSLMFKGVGPGTVVGIMIDRGFERNAGMLGILKAGGTCLPVDPASPRIKTGDILTRAGAYALVTTPGLFEKDRDLGGWTGETIPWEETGGGDIPVSSVPVSPPVSPGIACVLYAPGTGDKPGGIALEHRNIVNLGAAISGSGFKQGGTIMTPDPVFHGNWIMETLIPPASGMTVVIPRGTEPGNAEPLDRWLAIYRPDVLHLTPSSLRSLNTGARRLKTLNPAKTLLLGDGPPPRDLLEDLKKEFKGKIYYLFGTGETAVCEVPLDLTGHFGGREINIGRPVFNTRVYILDKYDRPQPIGIYGEMCIGGDNTARGYLNCPEFTSEMLQVKCFSGVHGGRPRVLFHTGEPARWLMDGTLEYPGRTDDRAGTAEIPIEPGEPAGEVEETLKDIWSEVLEIETPEIHLDSDFSRLNGQSLSAIMMSAKIHRAFDVSIPIPLIFELSTVRRLAEYIKNAVKTEFCPLEPVEEKEFYPAVSAQKSLYFLQQMDPGNIRYNVFQAAALKGNFKVELLEKTFKQLIERHETLRTSFVMRDDAPVQVVHREVEFTLEYFDRVGEGREGEERQIVRDFSRPFDLSRAPLLRVGLIKRSESRYILMIDRHHIISDGASREIFFNELTALYEGKSLPPLKLQYRDYTEWQNTPAQKKALEKEGDYWMRELKGDLPQLRLPVDFPRAKIQSFEGSDIRFTLGPDVTAKLKQIAGDEGTTLFVVLLTVFYIFLSKTCKQEDIIVGTPLVGRRHADLENIIGIFVNMLVLRNYPEGRKTFKGFLKEVKERTLSAFENQLYPFEELVDRVYRKRDLSRHPLFETVFRMHPANSVKFSDPGLDVLPYKYGTLTSKYDLNWLAVEVGDYLLFGIEYCSKLYKKETVERFIDYFKQVVSHVIENRDIRLKDIKISSTLIAVEDSFQQEDYMDFKF